MSFRTGFLALLAVMVLGLGVVSTGHASAERLEPGQSYAVLDDGGGDPRGADDLTGVVGEEQSCETGSGSTTCVWKGWLMANRN
jgi:hypothetical protein